MIVELSNVAIRQDKEGRYCLNDIHSAAISSGVTKDIRPNEWLSLKNTQRKVEILNAEKGCNYAVISKAGRYGGTYVCKELIYSYAMWISEEFELYVIRTFDQVIHDEYQRKAIRENAREGYKDLTKAIRESRGDSAKWYHYSNEADMINKIVIGCTAKDFRIKHDLGDNEHLRDKLSAFEILAIEQLQRMDEQLINMGFDLDSRREHLLERFSYLKRTMNISLDNPKPLAYNSKTN